MEEVASNWTSIFLERVRRAEQFAADVTLAGRLQELVAEGRASFPGLELPAETFVALLAERVSASSDPERALSDIRAAELYLACACAEGVPGAAAALETRFFPGLASAIAPIDGGKAFIDEALQALREKLLLPRRDGQPGISRYSGRMPLEAFLRLAARRAALDLLPSRRAASSNSGVLSGLASALPDPEVQLLKSTYSDEFRRAFTEALERLNPRQRVMMRMHYVDGLNTRRIGELYGVNQSTASRAISAARDLLFDETRRILGTRLELSDSQLDSLVGLVLSQIDVSLVRIL